MGDKDKYCFYRGENTALISAEMRNPYNHEFKSIKALLPKQSSMFQFRFFVDPVDSGGQDSDLGLFLMAGCLAGGTWQRQIQIQMQTEILVFERLLGTRWLAEA